ncbi:MAG: macro domain-containing protein [Lachnospiraceae bacterium]|nr:macro domain-containing protein [Lachnospiraceae bacterium]
MPLQIVRNNIVNMDVDAIVNTANPEPRVGGGTDFAVYEAAGYDRLLKARRKIGAIAPGDAAVTRGYSLPVKYIIHTVGPMWQGGDQGEREILRDCFRNSLELSERKRCRTVAFPLISAGVYSFPKAEALDIAVSSIRRFLKTSEMTVYLVVFGKEEYELSGKIFEGVTSYIDEHYVDRQRQKEYAIDYCEGASEGDSNGFRDRKSLKAYSGVASGRRKDDAAKQSRARNQHAQFDPYTGKPLYLNESSNADSKVYDEKLTLSEETVPLAAPMQAQEMKPAQGYFGTSAKRRSLDEMVSSLGENFPEMLFRLIDERGMTDVEVYKRANIDRKLFSKIRSKKGYQPSKKTAIALAIALRLNLDQTKDLLSRAGYALSPGSMFDVIVEYFITEEVYDIDQINFVLFDHHEQLLGA